MVPQDSEEVIARFEAELRLVESVVDQVRHEMGDLLERDEMVSFGQEGLLNAARKFDPTLGIPFRKYAYHRVRGNVLDGIRSHGQLPRRAYEKLKALQSANLIASGFYEDTAAVARDLSPENADVRLAEQLAVLATAMAIGVGGNETHTGGERVLVADHRPDREVEVDELMVLVHQGMATLTEQEATFVRRHFFDDRDIDEVAKEMGLSKSWGSRVMARGILKLAKHLRETA